MADRPASAGPGGGHGSAVLSRARALLVALLLLAAAQAGLLVTGPAAGAAPTPVPASATAAPQPGGGAGRGDGEDGEDDSQAGAPVRPALPLFAYYYQWFDKPSWDRAKIDYPLQGRYSSDDVEVMRRQVAMAKAAGIEGFLVSWKSTPTNDRRLRALVDVARAAGFHLGIVYQGLDFDRNPLPVAKVAADLRLLADQVTDDPVFHLLDKPVVIWSGTWRFTHDDVAATVGPVRAGLHVLASEKDVPGYQRLADTVDGNAYYWSSVDPVQYPGFGTRLREMGDAVHQRGGLWVAPFAPGFDARLVGGTRAVDRRDGQTLRDEYGAAARSSPDVLGLISWNEFSENTHVEPSTAFGNRYLDVLTGLTDSPAAAAAPAAAQDSSDDAAGSAASDPPLRLAGLGLVTLAVALGLLVALRARTARAAGRAAGRRHLLAGVALLAVLLAGAALLVWPRSEAADPAARPGPVAQTGPAPPGAVGAAYFQGAQPVRDPQRVVIAAAGDIACSPDPEGLGSEEANSPTSCVTAATADLVRGIAPDAVLSLGDHQYPNGSLERFRAGYDRTWGAFRPITHPVAGNHEYGTHQAQGYFDYFGTAAGDPAAGYYSYDLAGWHLIALNSECSRVGGCGAGSAQERWLRADLTAHPAACTIAYLHRPRYSSGHHGDNPEYATFWSDLDNAGVDLVLAGHDHDYERFAPLDEQGRPDPKGMREFVVGTGGDSFYALHEPRAQGSAAGLTNTAGVLRMELRSGGYDWSFQMPGGAAPPDSGSAACRGRTSG